MKPAKSLRWIYFLGIFGILWYSGKASAEWPQYSTNPFVIQLDIPAESEGIGGIIVADVNGDSLLDYLVTKAWTTDAFYRETPERVARRRAEGCLIVEMEAAALFAVAQFRGVPLGYILYGGDDVSAETWDRREWTENQNIREQLVDLAAEACLCL